MLKGIAGGVVALLLGYTTAHWVAVAQFPVSKGSADVKERVQTRQPILQSSAVLPHPSRQLR
jgi:hypothetical protein